MLSSEDGHLGHHFPLPSTGGVIGAVETLFGVDLMLILRLESSFLLPTSPLPKCGTFSVGRMNVSTSLNSKFPAANGFFGPKKKLLGGVKKVLGGGKALLSFEKEVLGVKEEALRSRRVATFCQKEALGLVQVALQPMKEAIFGEREGS
jgi:hypothetical protein